MLYSLNDTKKSDAVLKGIQNDIIEQVGESAFNIGFSGGLDSTALAAISADVLKRDKVTLVHVIYGPYTYSKTLENVLTLSEKLRLSLRIINMRQVQEKVLKNGPACNRCTRKVKIAGVRKTIKDKNTLVGTGANLSDSWGDYGMKMLNGIYAPFLDIGKDEIRRFLTHYSIKEEEVKIGESKFREGCKAKHLLKLMAVPRYHGHSVCLSNEILLDILSQTGIKPDIANVKIVGPLKKNIALINISPLPQAGITDEIVLRLKKIETVDEVILVDAPLELKVKANPSIFRSATARARLEAGPLGRDFADKTSIHWEESPNNKLHTFHVVDCRKKQEA